MFQVDRQGKTVSVKKKSAQHGRKSGASQKTKAPARKKKR
jgi:hypothetical protein